MATQNKPKSAATNSKKRKQRYLPHNKPVKKKGSYPLHPGVQGFFITCDGGRERQASHEAINVIDSFYEDLVHANDSSMKLEKLADKPLNKKIKFVYSDDEEEDDADDEVEGEQEEDEVEEEEVDEKEDKEEDNRSDNNQHNNIQTDNLSDEKLDSSPNIEKTGQENQTEGNTDNNEANVKDLDRQTNDVDDPPSKKQCLETCVSKSVAQEKVEQKSIDKLIEDELKELGDKSKRRFASLDSGCNGVAFVQMRRREGDPSPKDIVQHIMTSAASTKKHMSRFLLRVLPVEVACYASEEEISKAMAQIVEKYFPVDTQNPHKFAVLYEARANSGIDRMEIINTVAKSVPGPHKVDLSYPDKTIVVEIVKTVCLIGLVEKYKELAKYNLRQLTSAS